MLQQNLSTSTSDFYITVNDPLGRMTSYTVKIPDGDDVTYTYGYSNGGRTIVITDSLGRISTVMKNEEGQVFRVIDAAGNTVDYFYEDGRGNMTRKVEMEKKPDATEETYETRYEYNALNKIEKIIDFLVNLESLQQVLVFLTDTPVSLHNLHFLENQTVLLFQHPPQWF